jgi:hypothetical protein
VPFARLKLQPRQIEISGIGPFEPRVLIGENQLPIEKDDDQKQDARAEQTLVCIAHSLRSYRAPNRAATVRKRSRKTSPVFHSRTPTDSAADRRVVVFALNRPDPAALIKAEDFVVHIQPIGDQRKTFSHADAALYVHLQMRITVHIAVGTVDSERSAISVVVREMFAALYESPSRTEKRTAIIAHPLLSFSTQG